MKHQKTLIISLDLWQYWGLNLGPNTCKAGALPFEDTSQPLLLALCRSIGNPSGAPIVGQGKACPACLSELLKIRREKCQAFMQTGIKTINNVCH
jgi:hypothetical protein